MTVREARCAAGLLMADETARVPGFCAAYTAGSTNWMPDDAVLPVGSDVDVMVVVDGGDLAGTRRKVVRDGALVEVSYLARALFDSPERVLSDYHLAPSLATAQVVLDPARQLDAARDLLQRDYEKPEWIRARCESARAKVLTALGSTSALSCLFAAGITTHVLLVAGLRNPTVRGRYVAVRELLADRGLGEFHETLLALLGAERIGAKRAAEHVGRLAEVFDAACHRIPEPFPFAADIQACARPAAIDASLEMIAHGDHREAMFWIGVTWCRCMSIAGAEGFGEILSDLGLTTDTTIEQRRTEIERALPLVCAVAEWIIG